MKVFEREQMLLKQGMKQGIELEKKNTELERAAKERALKEVERLKAKLQKIQVQKL